MKKPIAPGVGQGGSSTYPGYTLIYHINHIRVYMYNSPPSPMAALPPALPIDRIPLRLAPIPFPYACCHPALAAAPQHAPLFEIAQAAPPQQQVVLVVQKHTCYRPSAPAAALAAPRMHFTWWPAEARHSGSSLGSPHMPSPLAVLARHIQCDRYAA